MGQETLSNTGGIEPYRYCCPLCDSITILKNLGKHSLSNGGMGKENICYGYYCMGCRTSLTLVFDKKNGNKRDPLSISSTQEFKYINRHRGNKEQLQ